MTMEGGACLKGRTHQTVSAKALGKVGLKEAVKLGPE